MHQHGKAVGRRTSSRSIRTRSNRPARLEGGVVRNTTTDSAVNAHSGEVKAKIGEHQRSYHRYRTPPSEHITAEENYQGNKTGYSNAETDPTTVQDTSVKTQTSRTDTQKRNTGTTQITRSLASSTRPTEQDQSERTRQSAGAGSSLENFGHATRGRLQSRVSKRL